MAATRLTGAWLVRALGALALAAAAAASVQAQPQIYGLAARVNGVPITAERLERNFEEYLREKQINIGAMRNPAQAKRLKRETLDALIDQELLWQEAQLSGVQVSAQQVDSAIAAIRSGYSSPEAFAGRLRAEGYTAATYAEHMRRLLGARAVLERAATGVSVSDDEVHAFYLRNVEQFTRPEQTRLRHIYLPFGPQTSDAQKADARVQVRQWQAAAQRGADFAALAREYSKGSSAAQGGDLGYVKRDELVRPLSDAAFALRPGDVSDVVELPDGLHLFLCLDHLGPEQQPEAALRERIVAHLGQLKAQAARDATMQRLRADARIEILVPLPAVAPATDEAFSPAQRARAVRP
jgi:parvulin-like peptidyl-prolyl isomerase